MEKIHSISGKADIHYWVSGPEQASTSLVFLPGLTVDHRLFSRQIEYFSQRYRTLVWDAPAHGRSRPWELTFSLMDMARYLREILLAEGIIAIPTALPKSMPWWRNLYVPCHK